MSERVYNDAPHAGLSFRQAKRVSHDRHGGDHASRISQIADHDPDDERGDGRARLAPILVDEAHRTQEGDLGRKMREALPERIPLRPDRHADQQARPQHVLGLRAEEDENGYMSRYSFEESIRDRATLPLHFEPRLIELHVDREAIDEGFEADRRRRGADRTDRALLAKRGGHFSRLVKAPERVAAITADIAGPLPRARPAERIQGADRELRPRGVRPLQERARRDPARAESSASRHDARPERLRRNGTVRARPTTRRRRCSTASATPTTRSRS